MIGHQAPCVKHPAGFLTRLVECFGKCLSRASGGKNIRAVIATVDYVVEGAAAFYSEFSGHACKINADFGFRQPQNASFFRFDLKMPDTFFRLFPISSPPWLILTQFPPLKKSTNSHLGCSASLRVFGFAPTPFSAPSGVRLRFGCSASLPKNRQTLAAASL